MTSTSTTLPIVLDDQSFARELAREVATPGVRPVDVIERLLRQHLATGLSAQLASRLIKPPIVRVHSNYERNRWMTFSDLTEKGYQTWYPEIQFATRPADAFNNVVIDASGIELIPIDYGSGIKRAHDLKVKTLKTQTTHVLRLNHIRVVPRLFVAARDLLGTTYPFDQPYLANPSPTLREGGNNLIIAVDDYVSFDHMTNGTRLFCSCAKSYHDRHRANANAIKGQYVAGSWPHHLLQFLNSLTYANGLCHLCIAASQGAEAAAERYGDDLQEFLTPYMNQLMATESLDRRTARAEVQQRLGISRWLREAELYKIVKEIFPDELVFREASPQWLGRQRLDIYLPNRRLAIEYQGEQHYKPVSRFGGAEAHIRNLERDALKKRRCDENAIELVSVRFDDPLTSASLRHRLRRFITQQAC